MAFQRVFHIRQFSWQKKNLLFWHNNYIKASICVWILRVSLLGPEGISKRSHQFSLSLMSSVDIQFREKSRMEELHKWDIIWERCWRRDISQIHICHRLLSFWIPLQQRYQSSTKCLFIEKFLKNARFIKLAVLIISLSGLYGSLAALEFFQRKSMYTYFQWVTSTLIIDSAKLW